MASTDPAEGSDTTPSGPTGAPEPAPAPTRAHPTDLDLRGETRWPVTAAIGVAVALRLLLPDQLTPGPEWLVPVMLAVLALVLQVLDPDLRRRRTHERRWRGFTIALIAAVSVVNLVSLGLLIRELLRGVDATGRSLVFSAISIWAVNVIAFALWYWELDTGGPRARRRHRRHDRSGAIGHADFLFPQDAQEAITFHAVRTVHQRGRNARSHERWAPTFTDYLYTSFTNATAFSPTDTMPLSVRAKLLMLVQSAASLITIALVAARAVNILG
ncbi:MAG: hypothetical protein U0Q07_03640 [Acidimicrobiales bacterium]